MATFELPEVTNAGRQRGGAELADTDDLGGALGLRAAANVLADLVVTPAQVFVELAPVLLATM